MLEEVSSLVLLQPLVVMDDIEQVAVVGVLHQDVDAGIRAVDFPASKGTRRTHLKLRIVKMLQQ